MTPTAPSGPSPAPSPVAPATLSPEERARLDADPWFAGLPATLREDLLSRASVRRLPHGARLAARGQPTQEWFGIVRGAVRVGSVSLSGRQIVLSFARPGHWLGDVSLVDGQPSTHDANAQGDTTLAVVRRQDFRELMATHPALGEALLQLNCRRLRSAYEQVESLATLPLAARLAQQLLKLARHFGSEQDGAVRIGLNLAQEDLAQMLGASRQRVNRELKHFERQGVIRVGTPMVVLSPDRLQASISAPE